MTKQTEDAVLKQRMNFSKMLERQEKQINETPHIKNLLTPSTKENSKSDDSQSALKLVNDKLERIEGLIEASRISRIENALTQNQPKIEKTYLIKNTKPLYALATSIIVIAGALIMAKSTPVIKTKTLTVAPKISTKYVVTDFINLRATASGSAKKLMVLAPNFLIERLSSKKDWHQVKFKDNLKGKSLIGWVYGKNFKKIN